MTARMGAFCAAAMLAATIGCTLPVGNSGLQVSVKANEQVVNERADVVARKLEGQMRRLGLEVTPTQDGDAVRLVSKTKAGQKFTVVVNRAQNDQARVRVEWDQSPDAALWAQLLSSLVITQTTTTAGR